MEQTSRDPRPDWAATEAGGSGHNADLVAQVYDELRALAGRYMSRERRGHTLQATALVNEVYIRMTGVPRLPFRNRAHFLALAATQMRRILVEHARAAHAEKRGGGAQRITFDDGVAWIPDRSYDLLVLDDALERLETVSPRQSRVAEARLFAGMRIDELAIELGVTDRTVKRDWRAARAWLSRELSAGTSS